LFIELCAAEEEIVKLKKEIDSLKDNKYYETRKGYSFTDQMFGSTSSANITISTGTSTDIQF